MNQSPNHPMLPIGLNNANAIRAQLRIGLAPYKLAPIITAHNGATVFWAVAHFHNITTASAIVAKHTTPGTGTNWPAALLELDALIVPF